MRSERTAHLLYPPANKQITLRVICQCAVQNYVRRDAVGAGHIAFDDAWQIAHGSTPSPARPIPLDGHITPTRTCVVGRRTSTPAASVSSPAGGEQVTFPAGPLRATRLRGRWRSPRGLSRRGRPVRGGSPIEVLRQTSRPAGGTTWYAAAPGVTSATMRTSKVGVTATSPRSSPSLLRRGARARLGGRGASAHARTKGHRLQRPLSAHPL
jgi:hypothetical protein